MKQYSQPKIGIVTVLYNSGLVLEEFFDTLDQQTFRNFVVYAVNNASPDDSLEKLHSLSKRASFKTVILDQSTNWGVAKGDNIGFIAALGDGCSHILISNNDIVLEPTTLENLVTGMQAHQVPIVVPKIYYHNTNLIWSAGGKFDFLRGGTSHFGMMQPDKGQFDTPRIVKFSPGCFILIEKDVFYRVGMMDEKYFVYYEDTDFMWRVAKNNERVCYIPTSRLWHKESTCTGGTQSDFTLRYMFRNNEYFVRKNLKFPQKQIVIMFKLVHNFLRKPFVYNKHQLQLIHKSEIEGRQIAQK